MTLLHFGNLGREQTMKNTELYAKEVMSHMKKLWSEWEDQWSPKPLDPNKRARAAAL